jgi:hypothetical protein
MARRRPSVGRRGSASSEARSTRDTDRPRDTDRTRDTGRDRDTRIDDRDRGAVTERRTTGPARDAKSVRAREEERFGGVKPGSAFFGWLTATGMAVLLIALIAAAGAAVGLAEETDAGAAAEQAAQDPETVGLVSGIALLVILFLAYYCGGYVAGRMARFNGLLQGVAVWVWLIVISLVVAALGAIAGQEYDVFAQLDLPRIPVNEGDLTTGGLIALAAILATTLLGAILGGLAGMRFHRKVDAAGLEPYEG